MVRKNGEFEDAAVVEEEGDEKMALLLLFGFSFLLLLSGSSRMAQEF